MAEFTELTWEGSRGASRAARAAGPGTEGTALLGDQGLCLAMPLPRTRVVPKVPERCDSQRRVRPGTEAGKRAVGEAGRGWPLCAEPPAE